MMFIRVRNKLFRSYCDRISVIVADVGIIMAIVGGVVENFFLIYSAGAIVLLGFFLRVTVHRLVYGRSFGEEFTRYVPLVALTSVVPAALGPSEVGFWWNLVLATAVWVVWMGVFFSTISFERLGNMLERKFLVWHMRRHRHI